MSNNIKAEYLGLERRWRPRLDFFVILAALATIPIVILQEEPVEHVAVIAIDWSIWFIFLVDLLFGLVTSERRLAHLRHHWLGLAVVVLSFPLLPDLLAYIRVTRVVRLLRVIRVLSVAGRGLRAMQSSLANQSLMYVSGLTLLFTVSAAALMTVIEKEWGFFDSLWWAIVTVTTVGYGDIAPASPMGRLLAVVLMLCGLGLLSTLAATISTYFIGDDSRKDLLEIEKRLTRIEQLLNDSKQRSMTHEDLGETGKSTHSTK
jgi:voltage-gated potassium channel